MRPLSPEQPSSVGPYRLLGRLGAGGMGEVYLGRSPGGRTAAIKLVHAHLASDPEFRRRFQREVAAASRVSGDWTAPVLDSDTSSAVPWVATGYVPGPSLSDVVGQHGPLPPATVWVLAQGLLHALTDIHGKGLIHRDLKPSNVLITLDGPKVIDFGIAHAVDASKATRTGSMVGSPGYMAPEQIRGERVSTAADVFAFGAVLAYATTGEAPFAPDQPSLHTVLYRVLHEDPELGPEDGPLAGPLRYLVQHCLGKDAARRPTLPELLPYVGQHAGPSELWLPPQLTAQLGRDAAHLLNLDGPRPERVAGAPATPPPGWGTPPPAAGEPRTPTGGLGTLAPTVPPPPPPPARRRRLALLAGVTVLAVIAGTALIVNALSGDDESPNIGGDPTTPTDTNDRTDPTGPADDPAPDEDEDDDGYQGDPRAPLFDQLPESVRLAGRLTVRAGTYATPLMYVEEGNQVAGLEHDLALEIGRRLGVRIDFTPTPDYDAMLTALSVASAAGEIDQLALGGLQDTPVLRDSRRVAFVNHLQEGLVLIVPQDSGARAFLDVCGKNVVTWESEQLHNAIAFQSGNCPTGSIEVENARTMEEMTAMIDAGEVAGLVMPYSGAVDFLAKHPDSGLWATEGQVAVLPSGIAVPEDNEALRDVVAQAVQSMIDDGAYAELLDAWELPGLALESASVNIG